MREENVYFLRFVLLLIKAGGCILRKIVKKNIEMKYPDIRSFLTQNEGAIRQHVNRRQQDLLYSRNYQGHDIETWDISLLVSIAMNFFKDDIGAWKSAIIERIRDLRNEFCHLPSPGIDRLTFESRWMEFTGIIQVLSNDLTESGRQELNDLVVNIKSDNMDTAVNEIQSMDQQFSDDMRLCLYELLQLQAQAAADIRSMQRDISELRQQLCEIRTTLRNTGAVVRIVCTLFAELRINADNQRAVNEGERILLQVANDSIANNASSEDVADVRKSFDGFRADAEAGGATMTKGEPKCVVLLFTCTTLDSVVQLIDFLMSSSTQAHLDELARCIGENLGERVKISVSVPKEPLQEIVDQYREIQSSTEEGLNNPIQCESSHEKCSEEADTHVSKPFTRSLKFSLTCDSVDGILHVIDSFEGDAAKGSLQDLSEALSEKLGQTVTLETKLDVDQVKQIIQEHKKYLEIENAGNDEPVQYSHCVSDDLPVDFSDDPASKEIPFKSCAETAPEVVNMPERDINEREFSLEEIETVKEENEKLIKEILIYCDNPGQENPHVIMLLGCPGAGKSAFINTLHKALTGNYYCIAQPGEGIEQTVTAEVTWYNNCGVKLYNIENVYRKERIRPLLHKLPHFLDLAGFMDEEDKYKTLLELLIGGYIEPGTNIQTLQGMDDSRLRIMYETPRQEWKVTKICFVQSIQQLIPYKLMKCLQSVLRITDKLNFRKYTAGVFLILSKWDVVQYPDKRNVFALPGKTYMSLEEAEKKQEELFSLFNLKGVGEIYSRQWANFTTDTSFDNVYIENNALKCLKQLVQPGQAKAPESRRRFGYYQQVRLFMYDLWQIVKVLLGKLYNFGVLVAFPIIILAVVLMLLTQSI